MMRVGEVVSRCAHNAKIGGANPSPVIFKIKNSLHSQFCMIYMNLLSN